MNATALGPMLLLLACSAACGCASAQRPSAKATPPTAPTPTPCANVQRAKRLFVGFAKDQSLDDFEATALEAERLLASLERALCRLGPEQAGAEVATLANDRVEIVGVRFTRADLTLAEVELRSSPCSEPRCAETGVPWIVSAQRGPEGWSIARAAPSPRPGSVPTDG